MKIGFIIEFYRFLNPLGKKILSASEIILNNYNRNKKNQHINLLLSLFFGPVGSNSGLHFLVLNKSEWLVLKKVNRED